MDNEKLDFLKKIQLFSSLTDTELRQISAKVALKQFKKNEVILFEEETSEFMYIIIFGRVKVFRTTEDGKETVLAMHSSGDFFGEIGLIDGATAPATVAAKEKSLIAVISKKDFYSLLFIQKKILERLLQILCFRLRDSWKKIQILNFKNAHDRIKMLFFMLKEDHGKETPVGTILNIKLTHQDIADMAGLTRESVTRVLDNWQRDNEITILKDRFIQLNPDFLQLDIEP